MARSREMGMLEEYNIPEDAPMKNSPEKNPEEAERREFMEAAQEMENDALDLSEAEEENGTEKSKEDKKKSRLKKVLCAITAGLILFGSAEAGFAREKEKSNSEEERIEMQIQQLEKQKQEIKDAEEGKDRENRRQELENGLRRLNIDGLTLGEPQSKLRCICEQWGIYLRGKYLGNIHKEGPALASFNEQEFVEDVKDFLKENRFVTEGEEGKLKVDEWVLEQNESFFYALDKGDFEDRLLKGWGGKVVNNIFFLGKQTFPIDAETKEVKMEAMDDNTLVIIIADKDGTITNITCRDGKIADKSVITPKESEKDKHGKEKN